MRIRVKNVDYDVRFRQEFVESKSGKQVRKTTATLSAIDPAKQGAEKYTQINAVVLTQNVKDKDNKYSARRKALTRLLIPVFNKQDREYVWNNFILTNASIAGEALVERS